MTENILEHIAFECQQDPAEVRLANILPTNKMYTLLPQFLKSTEYYERRKDVERYNKENRWVKKGLGISLMQFPANSTFINVYPVTLTVYHTDGTVCISHGGIEIGQGNSYKIIDKNRVVFILKTGFNRH